MAFNTDISYPEAKVSDRARFEKTIKAFDDANREDPNTVSIANETIPKELFYAVKHFNKVIEIRPDASEELLLASRCQHIRRWQSPRSDYPEGRKGYLDWRKDLMKFHAETGGNFMRENGYNEDTIERVSNLNQKKGIKKDPECQTLEDALCLVFLEFQFADLRTKYSEEKIADIVKKTAAKMSKEALELAGSVPMDDESKAALINALS